MRSELGGIEKDWWLGYVDEVQKYFEMGDVHSFYNSLKVAIGPSNRYLNPVRATKRDLIKNKASILSRWEEHFSALLNKVNPTDTSFIHAISQLRIV